MTYDYSLIEISASIMRKKRKPQTLKAIAQEVFEKKGLDINDTKALAQFEVDFMISGLFIHCGVDTRGNQLWDLKDRQKSDLLERDVDITKDIYENDEDVIKNELNDDLYDSVKTNDDFTGDDDEEITYEKDDIEEELENASRDNVTMEGNDNDDIEDEDLEEEEDEIEQELNKRGLK